MRAPLDETLLDEQARGIVLLTLDEAPESLPKINSRKNRVVDLRYFSCLAR